MTKLWFAIAALAVAPALAQTTYSETVLHSFDIKRQPTGAVPIAGVIRDTAGNLYGTASAGGGWGQGVVYEVNTAGALTVLHAFQGGADGRTPWGGVIRDAAGNLYGTAEFGGDFSGRVCGGDEGQGCGLIYKLDATGHETVLYAFKGSTDGAYPLGSLLLDSAGNLYGITSYGGVGVGGTVFKLSPAGQLTVLYSFTGAADGGTPMAGVIRDQTGNLYGTTELGGSACAGSSFGCGVVYKLDTTGHETVLHAFTGEADGGKPQAGVIRDADGNLYGTTEYGGEAGLGVVFKLDPAGHETALYTFAGETSGRHPIGGLLRDAAGNLYGTTANGGLDYSAGYCGGGCGVVFKVDSSGQETVLYSFTGTDGEEPQAGVISDAAGNLYGTTVTGGPAQQGVVFKLDASGQETVLYSFPAGADGARPEAGLARDAAGNLYGTTTAGGDIGVYDCRGTLPMGCGAVYKIDPAGQETMLHLFKDGNDGALPFAGVTLDAAGNVYGTTSDGGTQGGGIVYKIDAGGHETVLHNFGPTGGNTDGAAPMAGVALDAAGNLYGTTNEGGTEHLGVLYKLDTAGNETLLHTFMGPDGERPGGVILDPAGNLYGTASGGPTGPGVVFELDTAGTYTLLHDFTGGADGGNPNSLTRDAAGNLYGTTTSGGTCDGCGVLYKLDTAGNYTVLFRFAEGPGGHDPVGAVILDAAGNFYGATKLGGASNCGVVFKVDSAGQETVLYSFQGAPDGNEPYAGVIMDPAGDLYGTTYVGGKQKAGTVFKLTPQ